MIRFVCAAMLLAASPGFAQTPYETDYFNVTGVAPDDMLNIRAEPDAAAEIIGTLAHDAQFVEVTDVSGNWAQVSSDERAGWAAIAYLERADPPWLETGLPVGLSCGGTEPFWSAAVNEESFEFNAYWQEPESVSYPIEAAPRARSIGYPVFLMLDGGGVAVAEPRHCSDGMSDLPYGWTLHIVLPGQYDRALDGCCTLRRE
ncbi:SH3 domain-containing protein [Hyphobacterium sp.]|uniref:SH3 domain-containing protein n=1 Tax=Hyphobacterium sp. TaxID=2004662 RepID=UPI003B516186